MGIPFLNATDDDLFDILLVKYPVLVSAWALLAIAPKWRNTIPIVSTVVLFFAVTYSSILVDSMFINPVPMMTTESTPVHLLEKLCSPGELKCEISPEKLMVLFTSLDGVHLLFSSKSACFGGWVHYCVFDLLAGVAIVRDSNSKSHLLPQLLLIPTLFFTMMFGPAGYLSYSLIALLWPQSMASKEKAV